MDLISNGSYFYHKYTHLTYFQVETPENVFLQASKTVPGILLKEFLHNVQCGSMKIESIDHQNFSAISMVAVNLYIFFDHFRYVFGWITYKFSGRQTGQFYGDKK